MDQTWITLSMDGISEKKDMVLPHNVPFNDLLDLIFTLCTGWLPIGIKKDELKYFISTGDGNWQAMSIDNTLEEAGVWDGYCINMERLHSYSTLID